MESGRAVRSFAAWALVALVAAASVGAAGPSQVPVASASPGTAVSGWWWLADTAVLRRAGLDGKAVSQVFAYTPPESPIVGSIAADPLHRRLFLAVQQGGAKLDVNEIARVGMDGKGYLRLHNAGAALPSAVAYDPVEDRVYWVESTAASHALRRMDAGGAKVATVLTLRAESVSDLEVDVVHRRLYWTQQASDTHAGSIGRANLDGTAMQTLYSGLGTNVLGGLGLDLPRGDLYWARSDGLLQRGALDGGRKPETVLRGAAVGYATALGVHRASGQVFWISAEDLTVRRLLRTGETGVIFKATGPSGLDVEN